MTNFYRDRVVLITGASSGIGQALAEQAARAGARVALLARRGDRLDAIVEQIRSRGGQSLAVPADVADRAAMFAAAAAVREQLGPIDLLIANAGVGMPTRLDPVNLDDVEAMVRVNLLGVVYSFAAVLPDMLARRSGRLAAVSSLAGYVGLPGESAYCATKAAVTVYCDGLRRHLRGRGVQLTTLCPGFVRTAMTEMNEFSMPGLLSPDAAARKMLRAIERGRRVYDFPTVTTWLVRLARRLPDWLLARAKSESLIAGDRREH